MKNIKFNEKLINRIISGGLGVVLLASGYAFGKFESKSDYNMVSEYLEEYSRKCSELEEERDKLEEEIDKLSEQKEKLQEKNVNNKIFYMEKLVVIEYTNADE